MSEKSIHKTRSFTLVEIMITVAIIGMLVSIAIPNFLIAQKNVKISQVKANLQTIRAAIDTYNLVNGTSPPWSDVSDNNGKILRDRTIPENPFSTESKWSKQTTPRNIVYNLRGSEKGTLAWGGGLGWSYNENTGEFWANTRTPGVNENEF
ncbi:MAG: type II secretion system protein [Candidatus Omnitrophica bacterium]|nr:type II secretion system protein [Candidatus Omnitrophota bacterium]